MNDAVPIKVYQLYIWLTSQLHSLFLLAIRLIWGWQFFQTGKGKLGNLDGVTTFFTSLHIPAPRLNAVMASTTECAGGLLLLLGLGGRLISFPLTIVMIVAYITAEKPGDFDEFVKATPFPFLFALLVVLFFGPGRFSVDYLLQRFVFKKGENPLVGFRGRRADGDTGPQAGFEPVGVVAR